MGRWLLATVVTVGVVTITMVLASVPGWFLLPFLGVVVVFLVLVMVFVWRRMRDIKSDQAVRVAEHALKMTASFVRPDGTDPTRTDRSDQLTEPERAMTAAESTRQLNSRNQTTARAD